MLNMIREMKYACALKNRGEPGDDAMTLCEWGVAQGFRQKGSPVMTSFHSL